VVVVLLFQTQVAQVILQQTQIIHNLKVILGDMEPAMFLKVAAAVVELVVLVKLLLEVFLEE
jgi:hypothetical protein